MTPPLLLSFSMQTLLVVVATSTTLLMGRSSASCVDLNDTAGIDTLEEFERVQMGRILKLTPTRFEDNTGRIKSPRFPLPLDNDVFYHCLYEIRAPKDKFIQIRQVKTAD